MSNMRYDSLTFIANAFRLCGGALKYIGFVVIVVPAIVVVFTKDSSFQADLNARFAGWQVALMLCAIVLGVTTTLRGIQQQAYGEALMALGDIATATTASMPDFARRHLKDSRSVLVFVFGVIAFAVFSGGALIAVIATIPARQENRTASMLGSPVPPELPSAAAPTLPTEVASVVTLEPPTAKPKTHAVAPMPKHSPADDCKAQYYQCNATCPPSGSVEENQVTEQCYSSCNAALRACCVAVGSRALIGYSPPGIPGQGECAK
jgi:hypothetical protein